MTKTFLVDLNIKAVDIIWQIVMIT